MYVKYGTHTSFASFKILVDISLGPLDLETFSLFKAVVTSLVERCLNSKTAFFGSIYFSNPLLLCGI